MTSRDDIPGFSKLSRTEKLESLAATVHHPDEFILELNSHVHKENARQKIYDEISENNISNFYLPFSVAPNFLINNKMYHVPMVTEESSVVAAASSAAKFWKEHGGFSSNVKSSLKTGHIHIMWKGETSELQGFIVGIKTGFYTVTEPFTRNMQNRGGGIKDITLKDKTGIMAGYYQLQVDFHTADSMGANFMNSCLENIAAYIKKKAVERSLSGKLEIIMSILSNYMPDCVAECRVSCPIDDLTTFSGDYPAGDFARRFDTAVRIAHADVYRAVTHNKGIFNGVDAVLIATGNDFRAVEAAGHSYASRSGVYKALSKVGISGNIFSFNLEMPIPVGTVGGLTRIHPLAKIALDLLHNPNAEELAGIIAAVGLANNFSAISALIKKGIQHGHMKVHLDNILNHLNATDREKIDARVYFKGKTFTYSQVNDYIMQIREIK